MKLADWITPIKGGHLNSNNPYLDPYSTYGGDESKYNTDVSEKLGNIKPQTEWTRMASAYGFGGNDRRGAFANQQFGKWNQAFQAAQLINPFLTTREFMQKSQAPNTLTDAWKGLSAQSRGLNNQSRVNVVRWG